MKKYLSVTALAARGVVYKLLGLTLLCALLRAGEFWLRLRAELKLPEAAPNIQWLLNDSRQSLIFGICFILLYAALCTVGLHARGGHPGYTLYRLRVSERVTAVLWAAVFAAALLIFWAAQAGASLLLCRLYAARVGAEAYDNQTFFVLFYQNRLLHSLLPLDETSRWLRNFCMAAGLPCGGVGDICRLYLPLRHGQLCPRYADEPHLSVRGGHFAVSHMGGRML